MSFMSLCAGPHQHIGNDVALNFVGPCVDGDRPCRHIYISYEGRASRQRRRPAPAGQRLPRRPAAARRTHPGTSRSPALSSGPAQRGQCSLGRRICHLRMQGSEVLNVAEQLRAAIRAIICGISEQAFRSRYRRATSGTTAEPGR